ncbi:hypothetical protein DPMN_157191 [Dreissena polymorpha]|uniref:Uncharacterized protein n=1 Tax=Dreissena polymorpha TaxID=45954 RepID=A0A9D4INK4_DREPO|nr:hypothetical protein DPMN_157191 [Dreissena polymorpha]
MVNATTIGKQVPATTSHGSCTNNRETSPCDHISWILHQQKGNKSLRPHLMVPATTIGKQVPATTSHGSCNNNRKTSPCDHISWILHQQ